MADASEPEAPLRLDKGTRLEVFWEAEGVWYTGCVISWGPSMGHRILYDDRDRRWHKLEASEEDVTWRRVKMQTSSDADGAVKREEEEELVATPVESSRRSTRSMRHDVRLAKREEDNLDGLIRCPGCGDAIFMADGCSVTTCRSSKHTNGYYYFCAHCKAECPDGESRCTNCPSHNDRRTRERVRRQNREWRANNSAANPCYIE